MVLVVLKDSLLEEFQFLHAAGIAFLVLFRCTNFLTSLWLQEGDLKYKIHAVYTY